MKRQRIQKYALIAGLVLMLLIAAGAFVSYRKIRKQKKVIEDKNEELNQQNEEIRSQRDEIEAQRDEITGQRDLVTIQRDHIEEQKKQITDSITYAQRIQSAVLPDLDSIFGSQGPVKEFFVMFKPKDIVSGDFYWATRVNEWIIIAVADCTGHGVPGAFMSMLGVSFLNEIVRKKEVTKASDVLDHLRSSVIDALQQKETTGDRKYQHSYALSEVKDGMDIALCVINTRTMMMQYAGANNSLYLVSGAWPLVSGEVNQQPATSNQQLIELKPDRQPVGIYIRMKPFTNNEIQLNPGDTVFLASDGFEDQFGGPDNKKYKAARLKEMLCTIAGKPLAEQKKLLEKDLELWQGNNDQLDDITILGFRL